MCSLSQFLPVQIFEIKSGTQIQGKRLSGRYMTAATSIKESSTKCNIRDMKSHVTSSERRESGVMLKMIIKLTYSISSVTQCHRVKRGEMNEPIRARGSAALAFASCQQEGTVRIHQKGDKNMFEVPMKLIERLSISFQTTEQREIQSQL